MVVIWLLYGCADIRFVVIRLVIMQYAVIMFVDIC